MSITKKVHKISLVVDAQTRQLKSVTDQFKHLEREIGRVTNKVDVLSTHFKAGQDKVQKSVRATANASSIANATMSNDVVRHIRRLESLAVAFYGVKKAYDITLGRGHEFNKLIETETIGLKLLISQNLAHKDSLGNLLTPMQRFTIAQSEANKAIAISRKINLETPHNFSETLQILKLLTPQVLKYGGTLEQTGKITKNISIVASAMGVEFQQLLKTVDSAMSGEAKESGLKRALAQFDITNEAIKNTIDSGGSVVDLFIKKLENADVAGIELSKTWGGVTAKFLNIWDEIFAKVQEPMFEGMKSNIASMALTLKENSKSIIENLHTIGIVAIEIGKAFLAWKISGLLIGKFKALQFGMARTMVMAKQSNGLFTAMDLRLIKLELTAKRVGTALKTMMRSNLPLLGMMAVYETWNILSGQIAKKEENLTNILGLKATEMEKLTKAQAQQKLLALQEAIAVEKINIQKALYTRAGHGIKAQQKELNVEQQAELDTHAQKVNEMLKQEELLSSIVNGTHKESEAVYKVKDGVEGITEELAKASEQAYNLNSALIKNSLVSGDISNISAIKKEHIAKVNMLNESKSGVELETELLKEQTRYRKESQQAHEDMAKKRHSLEANYNNILLSNLKSKGKEKEALALEIEMVNSEQIPAKEKLLKIETLRLTYAKNSSKASVKGAKDEAKALKETTDLYRNFLTLTGDKSGLFQLDVSETMDEFLKDGTYTMKQLSDVYDGMWKKYQEDGKKANKKIAMDFTDQFKGLLDGIFSGDFGGAFKGFFDGISTELLSKPLTNISESINETLVGVDGKSGLLGGLGDFGGIVGGLAMSGIGMLMDSFFGEEAPTPPELEDIAKTSESMSKALDSIKDAQYPMLQLTRQMNGYLSIIANSFGAIENSLLRSDIDFAGNYYQEQTKSGAGGLSTKDYTLYGTTLDFGSASITELMSGQLEVERNTIIKKVYDSLWKTKTTYFNNYEDVSNLFSEDIADATKALFSGFNAIGDQIGINLDGMMDEVIDIGKIDTTGKTSQEIAQEIEARFSAQTDAIAQEYLGVVAEFQKAGEGLAETAFRVAMTFDQVSHSMELVGKNVDWRTANIIEQVSGGIDIFNANMGSYMSNFFTEQEQYEMKLNTMTKSFASLGIAIPDTNEEFKALVQGIDTTTDAGATRFAEVISLADGFSEATSMAEKLAEMEAEAQKDRLKAIEDARAEELKLAQETIKKISDTWLGNLSYLTLQQKADYASGYFDIARQSNGEISTVDSARAMAELALKTTATKEEYIPIFNRYITALENEAPVSTLDDVVAELRELQNKVVDLEETTRKVG